MIRVLIVQHEADTGIGRFGAPLTDAGIESLTVGPGAGAAIPTTLEGFDGLIVLGGSPGPQEDSVAPWLPRVRSLIAEALDTETPYLGICLGAQMLAVVAGGTVEPVLIRPEIGLSPLALTDAGADDPLTGHLPASTRSVQWHYEEITTLPEGSVSLMSSPPCPNQAFRVGSVAWGVQFHPEASRSSVDSWSAGDRKSLESLGLDAAELVAGVDEADPELDETWIPMLRRWTATLQEREPVVGRRAAR